jgi:biopolymer transport protein ExbB
MNLILHFTEPMIYIVQACSGLYGTFLVILLFRTMRTKKFKTAAQGEEFLDEVREKLYQRDFDGVAEICDSPPYWNKTTAQLILVALANRDRGPVKVRQLVADKFERDVLAELRHRHSWVATVTRAAPLLGLLGTVTSMVLAFARIGGASKSGLDPGVLAKDLSLALQATMLGLWIAVPMTLFGSMILVRIGKFTDSVQEQLGEFNHDLEVVMKNADATGRAA